jgi:putative SbcD/Mre11-related phosphoesterase
MPLSMPDDTIDRLAALVAGYRPTEVVLLGDIVHRAIPVPALRSELESLVSRLSSVTMRWVAGNHDRRLGALLEEAGLQNVALERELVIGPHLLTHGDQNDSPAAERFLERQNHGRLIMGHEHPAISLSDGVTTSIKCPCFLASDRVLVLPAFSGWAAGGNVRTGRFMSPFAQAANFTHAYAIVGSRILPVALQGAAGGV